MAVTPLVLLNETIVSGGAVTTLTTGVLSPAILAGKVYNFEIGINPVDASTYTYNIYMNGDLTSIYYYGGYFRSNDTAVNTTNMFTAAVQNQFTINGTLSLQNGHPRLSALCNFNSPVNYAGMMYGCHNESETDFDELQITCTTASKIDNGSYIRIWEAIQSV